MQEIVEKTGMSKGAFYHYFDSKEQLFIEAVETFYIAIPTTPQKSLNTDSLYGFYHDYLKHISSVFKSLRKSMKATNPEQDFNFFSLGLDAMKRYPGFREKIRKVNEGVSNIWINVVKTARKKGEIASVMSDKQIANCFIYINEGIGSRYTLEGRGIEAEKELLHLWDSFYKEIKA